MFNLKDIYLKEIKADYDYDREDDEDASEKWSTNCPNSIQYLIVCEKRQLSETQWIPTLLFNDF